MRAPNKTFNRARALRRAMSLPEVVLWQALRKERLAGLRFRRQHPMRPYILDFYCPAARLAVEVDGFAHDTAAQFRHDERQEAWLAQQGVRVLRFRATDVLRDESLEGVLAEIEQAAAPAPSGAPRAPPPPWNEWNGGGDERCWPPYSAGQRPNATPTKAMMAPLSTSP